MDLSSNNFFFPQPFVIHKTCLWNFLFPLVFFIDLKFCLSWSYYIFRAVYIFILHHQLYFSERGTSEVDPWWCVCSACRTHSVLRSDCSDVSGA